MIKNFYKVLILLVAVLYPVLSYADETILFKYLNKDQYSLYVKTTEGHYDKSFKSSIAKELLRGHFSLSRIQPEYYETSVIENLNFFGFKFTQYTFTPLSKDRFKHIVWLDENQRLIKLEVYDNYDILTFAFSGLDLIHGTKLHGCEAHRGMTCAEAGCESKAMREKRKSERVKKGHFRMKPEEEFYKGFRHFHTSIYDNRAVDLAFDDGLSKVSVFIKKAERNMEPVSTIVYGNYLLSRVINDIEYTVYGSVPYATMEEFINILHDHLDDVIALTKEGKPITKSIYIK